MAKLIEYDTDDNNVIETLRLISEMDTNNIELLFEAFCFYVALCYAGDENIRIPYLGDLKINKDTKVVEFIQHKNFKNTLEQLDEATKSGMIMNINLVKLFQNRIKNNLKDQDCIKELL